MGNANTVAQMRIELVKKYNEAFVKRMKDNQVIAVYRRLQSKNQI